MGQFSEREEAEEDNWRFYEDSLLPVEERQWYPYYKGPPADSVASTSRLAAPKSPTPRRAAKLPPPRFSPPQLLPSPQLSPRLPVLSKTAAKKARKRAREELELEQETEAIQQPVSSKKAKLAVPKTTRAERKAEQVKILARRQEADRNRQENSRLVELAAKRKRERPVGFACDMAGRCQQPRCKRGHPLSRTQDMRAVRYSEWCQQGRRCRVDDCGFGHPNAVHSWDGTERGLLLMRAQEERLQAEQKVERDARMENRQRGNPQGIKARTVRPTAKVKQEPTKQPGVANRARAQMKKAHLAAVRATERAAEKDAAPHLVAERPTIRKPERRGAEELNRSREKQDRRVEAVFVVRTEAQRLDAEMRASGMLASIRKELTTSHRHIWTDPSCAPVDWEDEEIGLRPIIPPPRSRRLTPPPIAPSKSAPAPDRLPFERRELAPLQNVYAGPFRSPVDLSREAVPTGSRRIAPLPRRDLDPPYPPQHAYPPPPPRSSYPAYPHQYSHPSYPSRNPYPYPPRSANHDFPVPPRQPGFPPPYNSGSSNKSTFHPREGGYSVYAFPPPQKLVAHRYSATYVAPTAPSRRPSERELLEKEMVRMEAELVRLRSNVRR